MKRIDPGGIRAGLTALVLSIAIWQPLPASAQFERISKAEVSKELASSIPRSRLIRHVVRLDGSTLTARSGFRLWKHTRGGGILVLDAAVSKPPTTRFDNDVVWHSDGTVVHYFCACKEENVEAGNDNCEFQTQGNRNTPCVDKGGGAGCTCTMGVAIMDAAGGTEALLDYAGDPW